MRERACLFRRLTQRLSGRDSSSNRGDVGDERFSEVNEVAATSTSGRDSEESTRVDYNVLSLTSLPLGCYGAEIFDEKGNVIEGRSKFVDDSNDSFHEFAVGDGGSLHRFNRCRERQLRSRGAHHYSIEPRSSLESCLTAQLYKEHAKMEENALSLLPSPSTSTERPLLVTDGSRIISNGSHLLNRGLESNGSTQGMRCSVCTENGVLDTQSVCRLGSLKLPRRPKKRFEKEQLRRSSNSRINESGILAHSKESSNGMLLFFLGVTVGLMSTVIANKREVDKLTKLLRQTENLVQDLHEELGMKDLLIVKDLTNEVNESRESEERTFANDRSTKFCSEQEVVGATKKSLDDKDNLESMRDIEAELEAELERLEKNMKASSVKRISDHVELDPEFEVDVIHEDWKLDAANRLNAGPSDLDRDAIESPTHPTHTTDHAVSPMELSLRLHEVIQSRLEARIVELETALECSQQKLTSMKPKHIIFSQRALSYGETDSSSPKASPAFCEHINADQPLVINLAGEALHVYNKVSEEIIKMPETDEEIDTGEATYIDKKPLNGRQLGENEAISYVEPAREHGSKTLAHEKIRTWEEQISRSQGPNENEVSESEDDEISKLLIKVVEKTRQGSPAVLNVQRILNSFNDQQNSD